MIIARIEFKPGCGPIVDPQNHDVVEAVFESVPELISLLREIEDELHNCIVRIDGKTFDLLNISGVDPSN
jgi:hypothetical protein